MALLSTFSIPFTLFRYQRWSAISESSISVSNTLIIRPIKHAKVSSPSIPVSTTLRFASSTRFRCRASSSSSSECNMSSSTKIFIKGLANAGLPLSTSEGRLLKAFMEFGEVSQVKLLMDEESGKSLGCAYIWFAKEESAQLAVKEMNGKFFDGRFIYVTMAKPRSSKSWRKTAPYKF